MTKKKLIHTILDLMSAIRGTIETDYLRECIDPKLHKFMIDTHIVPEMLDEIGYNDLKQRNKEDLKIIGVYLDEILTRYQVCFEITNYFAENGLKICECQHGKKVKVVKKSK